VQQTWLTAFAFGLLSTGCGSSSSFGLTITIVGDGTVTAAPGGPCTGPETCPVIEVSPSVDIVLEGAPAPGWVAESWELDVDGATVTLPVDRNGTVTLSGNKGSQATVTVTFVPVGSGPTDGGTG
jgi:hypothetical protein